MRARIGVLAVVVAAAAFSVPAAGAGLLDPILRIALPTCGSNSYPFAQFGDQAPYYGFTNNGFESGAYGWSTSGAVSVAGENEPFRVNGGGSRSLALAPGASATSPAFCINLLDPAVRGFARSAGASGDLQIQVLFRGLTGNLLGILNVGSLDASDYGSWAPTSRIASLLGLPLLTTSAQIRVTNTGRSGNWLVDDVFVDPCIGRIG
jgi:hypothetical protein